MSGETTLSKVGGWGGFVLLVVGGLDSFAANRRYDEDLTRKRTKTARAARVTSARRRR
jgi:hypothetical protein